MEKNYLKNSRMYLDNIKLDIRKWCREYEREMTPCSANTSTIKLMVSKASLK